MAGGGGGAREGQLKLLKILLIPNIHDF